jgi:hypothetical protein
MKKAIIFLVIAVFVTSATQAQCKCGASPTSNNWSAFTVTVPALRTVKCGHQFKICAGDSLALKGKFKCTGCNAYYKTVLKKDGAVVAEKGYEMADFFFQNRFANAGKYELTINPVCGGNLCRPCIFYITVVKCG